MTFDLHIRPCWGCALVTDRGGGLLKPLMQDYKHRVECVRVCPFFLMKSKPYRRRICAPPFLSSFVDSGSQLLPQDNNVPEILRLGKPGETVNTISQGILGTKFMRRKFGGKYTTLTLSCFSKKKRSVISKLVWILANPLEHRNNLKYFFYLNKIKWLNFWMAFINNEISEQTLSSA